MLKKDLSLADENIISFKYSHKLEIEKRKRKIKNQKK